MQRSIQRRRLFVLAVFAATVAMFAAMAGSAEAGTYLKGKSCSVKQYQGGMDSSNVCLFTFDVQANYQCYTRFVAGGGAPYASHRAIVGSYEDSAATWPGSYTTAQTAYSAIGQCNNYPHGPTFQATGVQLGGGNVWRSYTLQLYSGTY